MRSHYTKRTTTSGCRGRDLTPPWRNGTQPFRRSKRPMDSRGRRNVIMTAALIDGKLFGGVFIVCMTGILGMGMELVLRR